MLVCEKCGGKNIQIIAWVDANTDEYVGEYSDGDQNDNWCDDCQDHTAFIEEADYKQGKNQDFKDRVYELYCDMGQASAIEFASKNPDVDWEYCKACEADSPTLNGEHECLICGQQTEQNGTENN